MTAAETEVELPALPP
jgi:hypothetical protein